MNDVNVNARHSVPWETVSTPPTFANFRGALRTAAVKSTADSAPWYYQGDMAQHAFNMRATINGVSGATPQGERILAEYKAAHAAGWEYTNVRASSFGTLWVFIKGKEVLTRAGAAALVCGLFHRPDIPPHEAGYDGMVRTQMGYSERFADWLATLPATTLDSPSALGGKISTTKIGEWVSVDRSLPGEVRLWFRDSEGKRDVSIAAPSDNELLLLVAALSRQQKRTDASTLFARMIEAGEMVGRWKKEGKTAGEILAVRSVEGASKAVPTVEPAGRRMAEDWVWMEQDAVSFIRGWVNNVFRSGGELRGWQNDLFRLEALPRREEGLFRLSRMRIDGAVLSGGIVTAQQWHDFLSSAGEKADGALGPLMNEARHRIRPDIIEGMSLIVSSYAQEQRTVDVEYHYRLRNRPVGIGTAPNGFLRAQDRAVVYPFMLQRKELVAFEIEPVGARLAETAKAEVAAQITPVPDLPASRTTGGGLRA